MYLIICFLSAIVLLHLLLFPVCFDFAFLFVLFASGLDFAVREGQPFRLKLHEEPGVGHGFEQERSALGRFRQRTSMPGVSGRHCRA